MPPLKQCTCAATLHRCTPINTHVELSCPLPATINVAFEDAAALAAAVRQHGLGPKAFQVFEASRMDRVRDILTDQVPPFARATALATAITFEPLWSPSDLPAGAGQVGSVEEGLAWSQRKARGILSRRLTELGLLATAGEQPAAAEAKIAATAAR